jgi:hypothetical protein
VKVRRPGCATSRLGIRLPRYPVYLAAPHYRCQHLAQPCAAGRACAVSPKAYPGLQAASGTGERAARTLGETTRAAHGQKFYNLSDTASRRPYSLLTVHRLTRRSADYGCEHRQARVAGDAHIGHSRAAAQRLRICGERRRDRSMSAERSCRSRRTRLTPQAIDACAHCYAPAALYAQSLHGHLRPGRSLHDPASP